ncbi:MAG: hypothetical protein EOO01_41350, partial [Chitinophagaceae bacterium]
MKMKGKGLLLSILVLLVFSCQEEESTINTNPDTLVVTSSLTSLLKRVVMSETSIDNAIDSSNCVEIQLPLTINFPGGPFTLSQASDYTDLGSIPTNFYNGLQFPITITRPNHTTAIINSQAELDAETMDCDVFEESINCINFNYPLEVFEYDSANQIQDDLVFSSDAEFYNYLTNLRDGFYFTIGFPVSATFANGETIEISSNEQLLE